MIAFLDLPGLRELVNAEPAFASKMVRVAQSLGLDASLLLNIMSLESGLNPRAVNPQGGASGLIQFMPATARALGTTVQAIRAMTGVEQLDLVQKFYAPLARRIRAQSPGDYYMATFLPGYLGASPSTVLGEQGSSEILPQTNVTKGKIYDQNRGLDVDGDGRITIADVVRKAESRAASAQTKPRLEVADVPLAVRAGRPSLSSPSASLGQSPACLRGGPAEGES